LRPLLFKVGATYSISKNHFSKKLVDKN